MGIAGRLNSTSVHKRKSRTTDSRGGNTFTFATITASLACRVSMKVGSQGSDERNRGSREEGLTDYKIFVGPTDIVQVHDTLTIGSMIYEVVGINRPSKGLHIELEAILVEAGS